MFKQSERARPGLKPRLPRLVLKVKQMVADRRIEERPKSWFGTLDEDFVVHVKPNRR